MGEEVENECSEYWAWADTIACVAALTARGQREAPLGGRPPSSEGLGFNGMQSPLGFCCLRLQ